MKVHVTGREGFVLPVVIFAMAIMGVLAVASLSTADDERRSSRALRESGAAQYAAEAGLNIVKGTVTDTLGTTLLDSIGPTLTPGDSADLGWKALPDGGRYRAVIQRIDDDGGGAPMLGVTVRAGGAGPLGGRSTVFTAYALIMMPVITSALFGTEIVNVIGGSIMGDVGSNGDLKFGGGASTVSGDVVVSGTVDEPAQVGGTVTEGAPPVTMPDISCPAIPWGPGFDGGGGTTFDPATGDQNIGGGYDAILTSGTYYFHDFKKAGNGEIIVPLGASVEIYISGDLKVGGNGFINLTGDAENLRIWACGSSSINWELLGSSDVNMSVYAPLHNFKIGGGADRTGYFVGKSIDKAGNGNIIFGDGGGGGGGGGGYVAVRGSWRQLLN